MLIERQPLPIHIFYKFRCFDEDGNLLWEDGFRNLVVNNGLNYLLATGSVSAIAAFLGLVDGAVAPTYAAGDTLASHAGWTENQAYTQTTRPAITWGAASGGSMSTSSAVAFSINATGTIAGAFTADNSTKGGTTGNLYSEGSFSGGNQSVASGNTLNVSLTMTL